MDIIVKTIPSSEQRYPTVGDWWFELTPEGEVLQIRVSDMDNKWYEFLVAQHEQTEAMLCLKRRIKETDVSAFDKMFEAERELGKQSAEAEPGDDPRAPYKAEHFFATSLERLMAAELKVDWRTYDEAIQEL